MPGPGPRLAMSVKMEKLDDTGGREKGAGDSSAGGGRLDAQLWHACAGGMVQLPPVGAKVIYFPQGHGEQAATTPDFPRALGPSGTITCRVVSVNFLADTETDEVFARMRLQPEGASFAHDLLDDSPPSPPPEKPASFAKTLTQSDANNGGGFSVPRYCAETIFPPLDYSTDPPVQTVLAKDVHGDVWKFRHIYRGTPRRHLLTTGWSTFVNQKKLVAGDAIVFLRSASGELCVGVRRSMRGTSGGDSSTWHSSSSAAATSSAAAIRASRWEVKGTESFSDFLGGGVGDNINTNNNGGIGAPNSSINRPPSSMATSSFARNRARVTAKSVLEAASLAVAGKPFEVVYYPRASTAEFCVKAALVKQALDHTWYAGMRFKMAFETEDSSRISWFMGTIAAVQSADPLLWPNSPWRVLQVTWDEPDLLQGVSRVSPWQVELVATLPMQLPPFSLPKKKLRAVQPPELQAPGLLGLPPMAAGPSSFVSGGGQLLPAPWGAAAPALLDDASAGMQGARHDRFNGLPTVDFWNSNTHHHPHPPNPYKHPREFPADNYYHDPVSPARSSSHLPDPPPPPLLPPTSNNHNHHTHNPPNPFSLLQPTNGHGHGHLHLHLQQHHQQRAHHPAMGFAGSSHGGDNNNNNNNNHNNNNHNNNPNPAAKAAASPAFFLFGQSIDLTHTSKSQQQGNSSSDGGQRGVSTTSNSSSDNTAHENKERVRRFLPAGARNGGQSDPDPSSGSEIGSLEWFKDQGSQHDAGSHCKVFREGDEVGRTLDLTSLHSYDELHDRLAAMFSVPHSHFQDRVVYRDGEGATKHVGAEPYRSFVKAVRRLTILPEAGGNGSAAVRS